MNRLKQVIAKKVYKVNARRSPDKKTYTANDELKRLSEGLGVAYSTVKKWYYNEYQPQGDNLYRLPEFYKMRWDKMFYKRLRIQQPTKKVNEKSLVKDV